MSLNFDLTKIADYESVCWVPAVDDDGKPLSNEDGTPRRTINPMTERLIFSTMAVGIGEITKANAQEWFTRLYVWESLNGTPDEDRTTPANVLAHVGLSTNVFPKEPLGKWSKSIVEHRMRRAGWAWEQAASEARGETVG